MVSPIRFVMFHIHKALVNIAPERKEQFEKELSDFTLEYLDTDEFICNVSVPKKHICLSRRVVELLWGISFGYLTFYTKVIQRYKPMTKMELDLTQDPEVAEAMKLLKWAYTNWLNPKAQTPWPSDLPSPVEQPTSGSMQNTTDELALCAITAYLHHELAHIRLNHTGSSSIEQEKEADYAMAEWILDNNLQLNDDIFIKRSLGIAVAMEALTAYGIYSGDFGGENHPFSYDRLINTISRYISDPHHIVWAFLASTLKLHLDNRNIPTPTIQYSNFKERVNSYADILSRLNN